MPSRIEPQAVENRIGRAIGTLKGLQYKLDDAGCKYGVPKHVMAITLDKLYVWLDTRYLLTRHELVSLDVRIRRIRNAFHSEDVRTACAMAIEYLTINQPIYVKRQSL